MPNWKGDPDQMRGSVYFFRERSRRTIIVLTLIFLVLILAIVAAYLYTTFVHFYPISADFFVRYDGETYRFGERLADTPPTIVWAGTLRFRADAAPDSAQNLTSNYYRWHDLSLWRDPGKAQYVYIIHRYRDRPETIRLTRDDG